MALTHQDGATFVTQRLKRLRGWRSKSPTCLSWARLRPTRDLDWHGVREVTESITGEGQLNSFQLDLLTDWTHKIAAARLGWRRGRPTGKLLVL